MSLRDGIASKYNLFEAWFYDRFIAMGTHPQKVSVVNSRLLALPTGARVLDIGCGGGQLIESLFAIRPDIDFVAIDNSSDQAKRAISRLCKNGKHVKVLEASAMNLPFANQEFDFVYSLASIKHWPDLEQGIREAVRVLQPGGGAVAYGA